MTVWPVLAPAQLAYSVNNDGSLNITGYSGVAGALIIPSTINGTTVSSIGNQAFYANQTVTSITISNGVKSIGNNAFALCRSLTFASLPTTLTNIGTFAFGACTNLTSVTFPRGSNSIVIPTQTFDYCYNLTDISLPDTVTSIGSKAFDSCFKLPDFVIPQSVTNIAPDAFSTCSDLASILVDSNNFFYSSTNGILFNKNQTTLLQWPAGKPGDYIIPESVVGMGDNAFVSANYLTNITTGSGLTNISINAFSSCQNLATVILGDSVRDIGANAFINCYNLTNIILGKGLTHIGEGAFTSCTNLRSVAIPSNVRFIDDYAFDACSGLGEIIIPDGVTNLGFAAFYDCNQMTNAIISKSVTIIGDEAFGHCLDLKALFCEGNQPSIGYVYGYPPMNVFDHATNVVVYYLVGTTGWTNTFDGKPTILWNPQVQTGDGNYGVRSNLFGFTITGSSNIPIVVEAATDVKLPQWMPLLNCTVTNGGIYFSDPQWTNYPSRFYRFRSP